MNVTRSRSISLICPAATSRSSALALNWGMLSISHSSNATGQPSAHGTLLCQRRAERFEPSRVIHKTLNRPCGAVVQDSHRAEQDAVGETSALGGVEEQVQFFGSWQMPTGALRGGAIAIKQPHSLLHRGPVQEGGEVETEGADADVIPVDEPRAGNAVSGGHEDIMGPER